LTLGAPFVHISQYLRGFEDWFCDILLNPKELEALFDAILEVTLQIAKNELKEVGQEVDIVICGDDLFVTNRKLLAKGIEMGSANATIIKGNQVGTVTDAWEATLLAQKANYVPVMSHRSGETTEARW
jgi:enolase